MFKYLHHGDTDFFPVSFKSLLQLYRLWQNSFDQNQTLWSTVEFAFCSFFPQCLRVCLKWPLTFVLIQTQRLVTAAPFPCISALLCVSYHLACDSVEKWVFSLLKKVYFCYYFLCERVQTCACCTPTWNSEEWVSPSMVGSRGWIRVVRMAFYPLRQPARWPCLLLHFFRFIYFIICICIFYLNVCLYTTWILATHGSQKRVSGSLGLELQEVVSHPLWVLGTELRPLGRAVPFLTPEPSLQPPHVLLGVSL